MINELYEASDVENSNMTGYWRALLNLYEYNSVVGCVPEPLRIALENEIFAKYNLFKENFQIIEEEITTVTVVRRLNEL